MLFTLAIILFVLWLLGVVGTYTIGGIVHVLLVVALVLFVLGLLSGRRPRSYNSPGRGRRLDHIDATHGD